MAKRFTYKGRYIPENPKKYKGDISNIIFRSLWERRFMKYCDTNSSIIAWSSEELSIPYMSPIDNRLHRYYPDFIIKVKGKDGINTKVIEVKPKRETKPPRKTKNKVRYMYETKTWGINSAKWAAAKLYCKNKNWEFKILTEDHIDTRNK
jgi:hypothetical protein